MPFKCTSEHGVIIEPRIIWNCNCLIAPSAPRLHVMKYKMFLSIRKLKLTYMYLISKTPHPPWSPLSMSLACFSLVFEYDLPRDPSWMLYTVCGDYGNNKAKVASSIPSGYSFSGSFAGSFSSLKGWRSTGLSPEPDLLILRFLSLGDFIHFQHFTLHSSAHSPVVTYREQHSAIHPRFSLRCQAWTGTHQVLRACEQP